MCVCGSLRLKEKKLGRLKFFVWGRVGREDGCGILVFILDFVDSKVGGYVFGMLVFIDNDRCF